MTFGVGSWRPSGRWWLVTPWWCWSPFTCTSSEVCLGCSGRSWACQRKGEFLCTHRFLNPFFPLILSEEQTWYHSTCLTCQTSWPGFGTLRHRGTICTYPSPCCIPTGLYPAAALLQLWLSDSYWPRQCTHQAGIKVRRQQMNTYSNQIAPSLWSKANNQIIIHVCWLTSFTFSISFVWSMCLLVQRGGAQKFSERGIWDVRSAFTLPDMFLCTHIWEALCNDMSQLKTRRWVVACS